MKLTFRSRLRLGQASILHQLKGETDIVHLQEVECTLHKGTEIILTKQDMTCSLAHKESLYTTGGPAGHGQLLMHPSIGWCLISDVFFHQPMSDCWCILSLANVHCHFSNGQCLTTNTFACLQSPIAGVKWTRASMRTSTWGMQGKMAKWQPSCYMQIFLFVCLLSCIGGKDDISPSI